MKIPVFCSLIPTELLASLGHELHFLDASQCAHLNAPSHDCQFHENLCSYAKKLYEYLADSHGDYDLIIVPTSCDAMKKLFNALKDTLPSEKIFLLNLPQNKGDAATKYLASELGRLVKELDEK